MDPTSGFPFCRVYVVAVANETFNNQPADWRTYRFAVEIFQEYAAKTPAQAEVELDAAIDAVMDKLNAQWKLPDGSSVPTVDVSQIIAGQVTAVEAPFGPALSVQLLVDCKTLIY